jgi:hypothetical protein
MGRSLLLTPTYTVQRFQWQKKRKFNSKQIKIKKENKYQNETNFFIKPLQILAIQIYKTLISFF